MKTVHKVFPDRKSSEREFIIVATVSTEIVPHLPQGDMDQSIQTQRRLK